MPYRRCHSHVWTPSLILLSVLTITQAEAFAEADGAAAAELELFRTGVASDEAFDRDLELARLDRRTGEYVDAMRTLEDLLDRVRDEHGPWDMRNVTVLAELAGVQRDLGNLEEAVGLYNQAVHVDRVNQGLHDISQVDLLDEIAELQVELGDYETANQLQEYAFYVQERTFGAGSPAVLPGLYRLANWWRRTGNLFSARALYEQAVRIVEANYGPDDVRLVDALQGLAGTYRQERYPTRPLIADDDGADFSVTSGPPSIGGGQLYAEDARVRLNRYGDGEAALERVVRIVDAQPGSTAQERAQARLDLADWYLVFDKWSTAFDTYAAARQLLADGGWEEARLERLFAQPAPLVFPLPEPPRRPRDEGPTVAMQGYVQLVYDVGDRGRVDRVDVVASQPEGLMDFRTRKALKSARFRPRFVAGEPVATTDVEYRHEFVYYGRPEEPEPPEGTGTDAADGEPGAPEAGRGP